MEEKIKKPRCKKCNTKLDFYGVTERGQHKYGCPKCYTKEVLEIKASFLKK